MKPILSITKEEKRTHITFDNTQAIILNNNEYNDMAIFLDAEIKQTTVHGFYFIGVGKWRWRILWWLIKLFSNARDIVKIKR